MQNLDWKLPLITSYLDKWANQNPEKVAVIQHEDNRFVSYKQLKVLSEFFALKLVSMGISKGDIVVTQLALFPEHVAIMYACMRIGAIFTPIDLRLKKEEVRRDLDKISPKIFFFHGKTPQIDFNEIGEHVRDNCLYIKYLIQVLVNPKAEQPIKGAMTIQQMMSKPSLVLLKLMDLFTGKLVKITQNLKATDPAIIIFTTGTTGQPKPAMMSHENIIVQNEILLQGTKMNKDDRTLVNLPASHVGCLTEALLSTLYGGGTAVLIKVFNVELSLQAIEKHKVTLLGQIPTQFRMMWADQNYKKYDLSSLRFAIYGGSSVDVDFLNKLASMAPNFGTGLGMTETAGFSTFTPEGISVEKMAGQVGRYFEHLGRVSIRKPMKEDGSAGDELQDGEIGEICYHPPIVFMGYYNFPEATKKAISTDGILYSGDIGYFKNMGSYRALYLSGREKFIIKQKGFQVFPDEVQAFIASHPKVQEADVVGIKHQLFDEAIFAFVRPKPDTELTAEEILKHCTNIAAFKRPLHVEIWPSDKPFPLTRSAKTDKLVLKKEAEQIVDNLRKKGMWDA